MSWVISGSETVTQDLFLYTNTVLLLKGDGTNGSTTILDSSKVAGGPKTVTAVGNAQISTAQSKFGGASIAFDGTDDRLTVPVSADFAFGTGNFTCECWARTTAFEDRGVLNISPSSYFQNTLSNAIGTGFNASKTWAIYAKNTATSSTVEYNTNTWYHVALVRSGTTTVLYVDGSAVITVTSDSTNYTCSFLGIGGWFGTGFLLKGFIDDVRITKGVARYTANFTPPTAAFPDI